MQYTVLGHSGLRVAKLCLGTMTFGREAWGADKDESRGIFDAYAAAGGNFIDTANVYAGGQSEEFVGEFIASDRGRFVLATKYTMRIGPAHPNSGGNQRKNMVQAIEASLRRLRTDYIDLYWVHAWDFVTPVEEVMRGLDDLVRAGKVLYIGVSNAPAWAVARANTIAELRGWSPFVAMQIEYNLVQRAGERELLPMARALDIAVTAWAPLAAGLLTGKYNQDAASSATETRRFDATEAAAFPAQRLKVAEVVSEVAREMGRTPTQVALTWLLQKGALPILGARSAAQVKDALGAGEFNLGEEQIKRLDEISRIELGYPHEFLARDNITDILYGGIYDRLSSDRLKGRAG